MSLQASANLKSRTYLGLILAQFLAAFNDQAIHIVAIFYAGDMLVRYVVLHFGHWYVDDKAIISVVTACFISPFFFFSTLAGMLADKYSKRTILVFWKVAEVGMMGLALVGFLLPHLAGTGLATPETFALWSAVLVVSVVFLMGTHSAFFVPAKYGVMPEILQATVLSRGNGFLEGTSFVAQILGTACGGLLYANLKSTVSPHAGGNTLELGAEWIIGLLLFIFAVVGALACLMMRPIPAAAPQRPLTWKLWQPLQTNVGVLLRSRPLALAVLGIAFFTFITLFARQTLLYDGETDKELQAAYRLRDAAPHGNAEPRDEIDLAPPGAGAAQKAELKVALLIALVGLGIGIGSPLAGALSGNKVELGLVPLGTIFLIAFTALMAFVIQWTWPRVICLVLVGVAASFYIVPLYTLLQHRAPKESKGNLVAMSNFINVAGGLLAVAVFYLLTYGLEAGLGLTLEEKDVLEKPALLGQYIQELEKQAQLPRLLFLALSVMIAGMLFLLCRKLPDFFVRALLWLRSHGRYRLKVVGLHNLPSDGPVLLATNCDRFDSCMQVVTATDRFTRFILLEHDNDERPPWLLRYLARRTGLMALRSQGMPQEAWDKALAEAARALGEGNLVGVTADGDGPVPEMVRLLEQLRSLTPAPILPVYCGALTTQPAPGMPAERVRRVRVVIGQPLSPQAAPEEIRRAIHLLGEWIHQTEQLNAPAVSTAMIPGVASASPTRKATDHPAHP